MSLLSSGTSFVSSTKTTTGRFNINIMISLHSPVNCVNSYNLSLFL